MSNDHHSQLSLLDYLDRLNECRVLPFPLDRMKGRVRRVAEVLSRKQGNDAKSYWLRSLDNLTKKLKSNGVPEEDIERQCQAFYCAVQGEINRRRFMASDADG